LFLQIEKLEYYLRKAVLRLAVVLRPVLPALTFVLSDLHIYIFLNSIFL